VQQPPELVEDLDPLCFNVFEANYAQSRVGEKAQSFGIDWCITIQLVVPGMVNIEAKRFQTKVLFWALMVDVFSRCSKMRYLEGRPIACDQWITTNSDVVFISLLRRTM
jgi:hypothetical protein